MMLRPTTAATPSTMSSCAAAVAGRWQTAKSETAAMMSVFFMMSVIRCVVLLVFCAFHVPPSLCLAHKVGLQLAEYLKLAVVEDDGSYVVALQLKG